LVVSLLGNKNDIRALFQHIWMVRSISVLSLFCLLSHTQVFSQKGDIAGRTYGISSGYRRVVLRDELESFRIFSGGGIPLGISYSSDRPGGILGIDAMAFRASLSAKNSLLTVDSFVGQINGSYLFTRKANSKKDIGVRFGVSWLNQASLRTYFFNTIIGGQDPFNYEIFSSPGALLNIDKKFIEAGKFSWRLSFYPAALIMSRDFHPIRNFESIADVPKALLLTNRYQQIVSKLSYRRPITERWSWALSYQWTYMAYRRSYLFQSGSHEIGMALFFSK